MCIRRTRAIWHAYRNGIVTLVQQRVCLRTWDYIVVRL